MTTGKTSGYTKNEETVVNSLHLRSDLSPNQFIVIGDTPNDIDCAHHFGARVVAINTGRFYSREDLLQHKPDAFLSDLSDTEAVIQTLAEL